MIDVREKAHHGTAAQHGTRELRRGGCESNHQRAYQTTPNVSPLELESHKTIPRRQKVATNDDDDDDNVGDQQNSIVGRNLYRARPRLAGSHPSSWRIMRPLWVRN